MFFVKKKEGKKGERISFLFDKWFNATNIGNVVYFDFLGSDFSIIIYGSYFIGLFELFFVFGRFLTIK